MSSGAANGGLKQCQFEPHDNKRYKDLLGVAASAVIRKQQNSQGVAEEGVIDVVATPASKMVVGFVGCGTISAAVVKGMCQALNGAVEIVVSPRNPQVAAALAKEFPARVTIATDNQAVLDASDVVCIGVTPQIYEEVLKSLSFRAEHIVISFMSTVKISSLVPLVAPATSIVRMIPMPPIAKCLGPLPIYPPLELVQTLFGPLGSIVGLENEDEFAALMSASSLMAPFYEMQNTIARWIAAKGLDPAASAKYTAALYHGLATDSLGVSEFETITAESQTPKGVNEQSRKQLMEAGWYGQLEKQMDTIYDRVSGKPPPS